MRIARNLPIVFLVISLLIVVLHFRVQDVHSDQQSRRTAAPFVLDADDEKEKHQDKGNRRHKGEDQDEDTDHDHDKIEHAMEKLHEGKKSPFRKLKRALAANPPAWNAVGKQLPGFLEMSTLLQQAKHEDIRDSADGYVDAVDVLVRSAEGRKPKETREAFAALTESCADCHFKGGVGGKLDD